MNRKLKSLGLSSVGAKNLEYCLDIVQLHVKNAGALTEAERRRVARSANTMLKLLYPERDPKLLEVPGEGR